LSSICNFRIGSTRSPLDAKGSQEDDLNCRNYDVAITDEIIVEIVLCLLLKLAGCLHLGGFGTNHHSAQGLCFRKGLLRVCRTYITGDSF
jgi:hypothetical protein